MALLLKRTTDSIIYGTKIKDGKPVIAAYVVVYNLTTSLLIGQTQTDKYGRWYIIIDTPTPTPGTYQVRFYGSGLISKEPPTGDWEFVEAVDTTITQQGAITYRGLWKVGTQYYGSALYHEAVKAPDGQYYYSNIDSLGVQPPNATSWTLFSDQFSSVATDLLLAQDVAVGRTITLGTALDDGGSGGIMKTAGVAGLYSGAGGFYVKGSGLSEFRVGTVNGTTLVSGLIWDGPNHIFEIRSKNFTVDRYGNVTVTGLISASAGVIGGWTIGPNTLTATSNGQINTGSTGTYITLDQNYLRTSTFMSGNQGFNISAGTGDAEFNTIAARGTFRSSVFAIDEINATGGTMMVTDAAEVVSGLTTPNDGTTAWYLCVRKTYPAQAAMFGGANSTGYLVRLKFADKQLNKVTDIWASRTVDAVYDAGEYWRYTVKNAWFSSYAQTIDKGVAVVGYGLPTSKKIILTSDLGGSAVTPYVDMFTTGASPWAGVTTNLRLGNLTGVTDSSYGILPSGTYGLYADNVYLRGAVIANSGLIGGWNIGTNYLYSNTGAGEGMSPADYPFFSGHLYTTRSSAPFRVNASGIIWAKSGYIGGDTELDGWAITSGSILTTLSGGALLSANVSMERAAFNSGSDYYAGLYTYYTSPLLSGYSSINASTTDTVPVIFAGAPSKTPIIGVSDIPFYVDAYGTVRASRVEYLQTAYDTTSVSGVNLDQTPRNVRVGHIIPRSFSSTGGYAIGYDDILSAYGEFHYTGYSINYEGTVPTGHYVYTLLNCTASDVVFGLHLPIGTRIFANDGAIVFNDPAGFGGMTLYGSNLIQTTAVNVGSMPLIRAELISSELAQSRTIEIYHSTLLPNAGELTSAALFRGIGYGDNRALTVVADSSLTLTPSNVDNARGIAVDAYANASGLAYGVQAYAYGLGGISRAVGIVAYAQGGGTGGTYAGMFLNAPVQFRSYLELWEIAAPGTTPASGTGYLYAKSADSLLYWKSDAGTEYNLTGANAAYVNAANTFAAQQIIRTSLATQIGANSYILRLDTSSATGQSVLQFYNSNSSKVLGAVRADYSGNMVIAASGVTSALYLGLDYVNAGTLWYNGPSTQIGEFTNAGLFRAKNDVVAFYSFSDERLKENITSLSGVDQIIDQLRPVEFTWKRGMKEIPDEKQGQFDRGLIAQEVEKILPNLVSTAPKFQGESLDVKTIRYEKLIPILLKEVQQLRKRLAKLEDLS